MYPALKIANNVLDFCVKNVLMILYYKVILVKNNVKIIILKKTKTVSNAKIFVPHVLKMTNA